MKSIIIGFVFACIVGGACWKAGDTNGYNRRISENYISLQKYNELEDKLRGEIDSLNVQFLNQEESYKSELQQVKEKLHAYHIKRPEIQYIHSDCNAVNADVMRINSARGYPEGSRENPIIREQDASKTSSITQQELVEANINCSEQYELWRIRYTGLVSKIDQAGYFINSE